MWHHILGQHFIVNVNYKHSAQKKMEDMIFLQYLFDMFT